MENKFSNLMNYSLNELSAEETEQVNGGESIFYWVAKGVGYTVGGFLMLASYAGDQNN